MVTLAQNVNCYDQIRETCQILYNTEVLKRRPVWSEKFNKLLKLFGGHREVPSASCNNFPDSCALIRIQEIWIHLTDLVLKNDSRNSIPNSQTELKTMLHQQPQGSVSRKILCLEMDLNSLITMVTIVFPMLKITRRLKIF